MYTYHCQFDILHSPPRLWKQLNSDFTLYLGEEGKGGYFSPSFSDCSSPWSINFGH